MNSTCYSWCQSLAKSRHGIHLKRRRMSRVSTFQQDDMREASLRQSNPSASLGSIEFNPWGRNNSTLALYLTKEIKSLNLNFQLDEVGLSSLGNGYGMNIRSPMLLGYSKRFINSFQILFYLGVMFTKLSPIFSCQLDMGGRGITMVQRKLAAYPICLCLVD